MDTQKQFFLFYSWDSIFSLSYKKNDSTPPPKKFFLSFKIISNSKNKFLHFLKKYAHMYMFILHIIEQKWYSNLDYSLRQPQL